MDFTMSVLAEISNFKKLLVEQNIFRIVKKIWSHCKGELTEDAVKYESYFWWHEYYIFKSHEDMELDLRCSLCDKLHEPKPNSKNDYSDLKSYWFRCRS